jgi:recombination protein RecA
MMVKKKVVKVSDNPDLINKELEKIGCQIFSELSQLRPKQFISTGMFGFDRVISTEGGFPGNSVVEIFGPNSTGKTSVALQVAAQAQKLGMVVYYVNAERAINASIVQCFPDLKATEVKWIQPDSGEAAIDVMKTLLKTQTNILVINDSIPACLPSVMADANAGDSTVGQLARLFAPFMPEAKKWCGRNENLLIQLNQERAKIGPMARGGKEQPGGNAVKFYSDIRIKLTKRWKPNGNITMGEDVIGHYIEAKMEKTRWAPPFQTADMPLIYGAGFDEGRELLHNALLYNVVVQAGAWYKYLRGEEIVHQAQGEDRMSSWIRQHPNVQTEIINRMEEILK